MHVVPPPTDSPFSWIRLEWPRAPQRFAHLRHSGPWTALLRHFCGCIYSWVILFMLEASRSQLSLCSRGCLCPWNGGAPEQAVEFQAWGPWRPRAEAWMLLPAAGAESPRSPFQSQKHAVRSTGHGLPPPPPKGRVPSPENSDTLMCFCDFRALVELFASQGGKGSGWESSDMKGHLAGPPHI